MKKFIAVLLAVFAAISLVACGGGGKVPELKIEGEKITEAEFAALAAEWDELSNGQYAPGKGWYSINYVQDTDMDYPENVNTRVDTFASLTGEIYYDADPLKRKMHLVMEIEMDYETESGVSAMDEKVSVIIEITYLDGEVYTKMTADYNGDELVEYTKTIPADMKEVLDFIDLVEFDSYLKISESLIDADIYKIENGVMFEEIQKDNKFDGVARVLMKVDQNTGLTTKMSAYTKLTQKGFYSIAGDKASYITIKLKQRVDLTAIDGAEIALPDDIELYQ